MSSLAREQMERKLQKILSVPITEGTHYIVELFPVSHLIVTPIILQKRRIQLWEGQNCEKSGVKDPSEV